MKTILTTTLAVLAILSAIFFFNPATASAEHLTKHKQPFTEDVFRQAQADGKLILIDVFAPWCPTCRKQHAVLNDYLAANPQSELLVLEVDFDNQKEWVTYFKAPRQSTLVLYRGEEQLWLTVAQTKEKDVFAAIAEHDKKAD
ncbi:hypothetical protein GCM10010919_04320 [Alishewanella longhuensis]|uniref:Thioredoxin domain-containing protein n=1 Tax=Alishewanella longhuensis TaxID=1091037 RepID=A0ABQ3L2J5_9ALTE|nr:thioredoxin family protein [Alishewanella longhuensis]GHG60678.1 hypothetical protein GCM10010919_04320 [Alishewanella longhuensis]